MNRKNPIKLDQVLLAIHEVRMDNWIYWKLSTSKYK
jgi:hypothetical protein